MGKQFVPCLALRARIYYSRDHIIAARKLECLTSQQPASQPTIKPVCLYVFEQGKCEQVYLTPR